MPSGPLSGVELADVPRTTVPRSEWIPGYRDPFSLHFPRPGEAGAWYPGIEDGSDPADLLEASTIMDAADRWRNHFRDVAGDCPALGIARLRGKFMPSSS
ncbi:hypothetical protein L917_06638 [Phytophthora nicotianae]|uniref:Uncharacterized protein n=2 Tax=Phytophthora nicotianae TaxID=4792 RepID=V9FDC6_PHYNI|nr:hypothetical protein F443_06950 [Phytophthora nicotianae P1569]ETL95590.1 hypothetical protein L917_06638 [Phytophthora nicotianae]ETM48788.1 hypothetical protein L914_06729 [Phytophthora nicotianae]